MQSANTFGSLQPNFKEVYADGNKKKFSKTRKALQGIGLSLHKASQNPKKYMKDQDMDISTKKGIVGG